jgi:tetratricopeptide (TPR) repeat protein
MRLAISIALLFGLSQSAFADDAARARSLYEKGTTLYDLGKYLDAAHSYEEAYALKNDTALLFNIGQAYRLGGDYASALRSYKSFLRRMPDAPNRSEVERHIGELQKLVDEQKRASSSPPIGTFAPGQPIAPSQEPREAKPSELAPSEPALSRPAQPGRTPVYKKWWLWTTVALVVAAGVGVGLGVGLGMQGPHNAPAPAGTIPVTFP